MADVDVLCRISANLTMLNLFKTTLKQNTIELKFDNFCVWRVVSVIEYNADGLKLNSLTIPKVCINFRMHQIPYIFKKLILRYCVVMHR